MEAKQRLGLMLIGLAPYALMCYLPIFPVIPLELTAHDGISVTSFAVFLFAMGFSQLIPMLLPQKISLARIIHFGLLLFILSAASSAYSYHGAMFIFSRLISGFSVGILSGASMLMFTDYQARRLLAQHEYHLTYILFMIAPIFGCIIYEVAGWRAVFWVLASFGLILSVLVVGAFNDIVEKHQRQVTSIAVFSRILDLMLNNARLSANILNSICCLTGVLIILMMSMFIFQDQFQRSVIESAGIIGLYMTCFWFGGHYSLISHRSNYYLISFSQVLALACAAAIYGIDYLPMVVNDSLMIILYSILLFILGVAYSRSYFSVLNTIKEQQPTALTVLTSWQWLVASVVIAAMPFVPLHSDYVLSLLALIFIGLATLFYQFIILWARYVHS